MVTYREADLHLCFCICKIFVFSRRGWNHPCSENKSTAHLSNNSTADLCLLFHVCENHGLSWSGFNESFVGNVDNAAMDLQTVDFLNSLCLTFFNCSEIPLPFPTWSRKSSMAAILYLCFSLLVSQKSEVLLCIMQPVVSYIAFYRLVS